MMIIYKILTFLLFVPLIGFGQKGDPLAGPPRSLTKHEEKIALKRSQCFYENKFDARQRRAFFPFNKSATVKLVSYESGRGTVVNDKLLIFTPVAANHFRINYQNIKESKILTAAGIDSLTDIMYNVGFTPVKSKAPITYHDYMCYDPQNAIVFLDSNGTATQYIEFCFECHHYYLSSRKIKNTVYCQQKFGMLQKFFLNNGIRYGTDFSEKN